MPNRFKENTGRKIDALDMLNIAHSAGGLYCLLQYDNRNENGETVFKCGLATNFSKRISNYHTTGSNTGVTIICLLTNIKTPPRTRGRSVTTGQHLLSCEKYLFEQLRKLKAKRIMSTTHIRTGETEQFFTTQEIINQAFILTEKRYGGTLHMYPLDGVDDSGKFSTFEERSDKIINSAFFVGKVSFI